jgi:predicted transcriptional regulator
MSFEEDFLTSEKSLSLEGFSTLGGSDIIQPIEKRGRGRPRKYFDADNKKELNHQYYKTFVTKNKIQDKTRKCEICGGSISHYYNKSHHNKTQKHIKKLLELNHNVNHPVDN